MRKGIRIQKLFCVFFFIFLSSCTSDEKIIRKGEASLRLGDYAMAIRFFDEVLGRNPENFDARLGMGKALIQQASAKDADSTLWSKALVHLEAARTLRPESGIDTLLSEAWIVNGRRLLNGNDTIGALNAISRAIDINPRSVEALNLAGIIYFRIGEPEKSKVLFTRALTADTLRPFTLFNFGMVCWSLGDIKSAHEAWFKAVRLAPADKDIVYWFTVAEKEIGGGEK